ncbi:MAG TPA: hypothetical protein VK967_06260 [Methylotenera sp.]|nr:hypothetical protein [Methylotenera sp.]
MMQLLFTSSVMRCWLHHLHLAVLNVLSASQMISPPSLTIELKLECRN